MFVYNHLDRYNGAIIYVNCFLWYDSTSSLVLFNVYTLLWLQWDNFPHTTHQPSNHHHALQENQEMDELSVELLRPLEKDLRVKTTPMFTLVKAQERRNRL